MKFNPNTHTYGKVYDLTQENMNRMIETIEHYQELYNHLYSLENHLETIIDESKYALDILKDIRKDKK